MPNQPGRLVAGALWGGGKRWPCHVLAIDGSQLEGSRTDVPAYGSLDLTAVGAPSNAIRSGWTVVKNGATKAAYDTVHGVEPGIVEAAYQAGVTTGKYVGRFGSSVGIDDILATLWALAVADIAAEAANAGGFDPILVYYAASGPDALTDKLVGAWPGKFRQLVALIRATCPRAVIVVSGLMSTDSTSFPKRLELNAIVQATVSDLADNRMAWWNPVPYQGMLQPDATHLTSAGLVLAGFDLQRRAQLAGAIRIPT